jgi:tubby-related protein 1
MNWERQLSQPGGASSSSSSVSVGASAGEGGGADTPASPTPAMRKAKMDEMRRAHLDKRKQKAMAAPTVLRANTDQIKSPAGSPVAASAASPSGAGVSSPIPFGRQMSFGGGSSAAHMSAGASAAAASPRASYPGAGSFNGAASSPMSSGGGDSDDEGRDGVVAVEMDPHMSSLIAARRAANASKHISQAERDMLEQGIAPTYDPGVKQHIPNIKLDYSDMRSFLAQPIPKGMTFQCYILRNKKGLLNKLYPTYECYVSSANNSAAGNNGGGQEQQFLMAARKRTHNKTSNYMISSDKTSVGGGKESASYLGKVRSNFVGTEFVAYDKGINPAELDALEAAHASSVSLLSVRQELCAVFYESNIMGSKGPRKMTAVVPAVRKDGSRAVWKPMNPDQSVAVLYKRSPSSPDYLTLVNKTPKWNDAAGAYVRLTNSSCSSNCARAYVRRCMGMAVRSSGQFDGSHVLSAHVVSCVFLCVCVCARC